MNANLSVVAGAAGLCLVLGTAGVAYAQQAYPNKPIRFVVPYTPGGITTVIARLVGQKLTDAWGQPVVVDNRPGGNATIGADYVAKAPPDGYTILFIAAAHVVLPHLTTTPYDAIKDFSAIASLDSTDQLMVVSPNLPVNNLKEFIALAKSKPGQLNFASAGVGSSNHLATELFNMIAGTKIRHIPYKGSAQAVTDVVAGEVQMTLNTPLPVVPLAKAGKLKAIAMSGEKRLAALPQVPTFAEAGLPGFEAKNWHGVIGPAGIPRDIVNKLSAELGKIMMSPDIVEKLGVQAIEPFVTNADQFAALMRADSAKWATVIKTAGIKME